jgi:periplasmic protein TonB
MHEAHEPGVNPNAHFMVGDVRQPAGDGARFGRGFTISAVSHVVGFVLVVFIAARLPEPAPSVPPERPPSEIVWIYQPGPGGGGGGGGDQSPEPPRVAEQPGREKITVPVAKPPPPPRPRPEPPKPEPAPEPPPAQVTIPAVAMSSGVTELPGTLSGLPTAPSRGSGTGPGAGTGTGTGIGAGDGSGLGEGHGGGTGGGAYRPGNDVSWPRLLYEKKPSYTADAMRAKVQGVVEVEALILPDGTVAEARITRSLDPTFGLDREALLAVRQWRFAPATRRGQPVAVLVPIEVSFTLR